MQKGGQALARSRLSWGSSCEMSGVNTRTTKRDSDRDARESQQSSTPHPTSTDSAQLLLGATGSASSTHIVTQGAPQLQPPTSSSSHSSRRQAEPPRRHASQRLKKVLSAAALATRGRSRRAPLRIPRVPHASGAQNVHASRLRLRDGLREEEETEGRRRRSAATSH